MNAQMMVDPYGGDAVKKLLASIPPSDNIEEEIRVLREEIFNKKLTKDNDPFYGIETD